MTMGPIEGTVKNGQIIISDRIDWPDGTRVRIEPVPATSDSGETDPDDLGMSEEAQGGDAESVARWLAEFDAIPPLQMTPEEEAEWQAARKAQKEFEMARFNERAEKLRRMWE
jgi:hypothetical protein